jgi:hypothetical protein
MSLTSLECQVSELVNSERVPTPHHKGVSPRRAPRVLRRPGGRATAGLPGLRCLRGGGGGRGAGGGGGSGRAADGAHRAERGGAQGSAALPHCTTAPPLHTRSANMFGAAVSEAAVRPDPKPNTFRCLYFRTISLMRPDPQVARSMKSLPAGEEEGRGGFGAGKVAQVRQTPCWPRRWANFSLLHLYSRGNAPANWHLLGHPDAVLAPDAGGLDRQSGRWLRARRAAHARDAAPARHRRLQGGTCITRYSTTNHL